MGGGGEEEGNERGQEEKAECRMKEGRKGGEGQDDLRKPLKTLVVMSSNSK